MDSVSRNRVLLFAGLLLIGLLLRAEYLREFSASPLYDLALGADVAEYFSRAREILHGIWFSHTPDIHAPLYPFFLAAELRLTDGCIPLVRGVQLGLNVLAWCGFYLFLRKRCSHEDWTPEWMFSGAMLYLPLCFFQAEFVSESLLLPLLLGAAVCMMALEECEQESRRTMLLAGGGGLLTGLAVITHPVSLLYFAVQSAALTIGFFNRRAWIYCGVALIVILPVSVYRSRIAGRPVLVQSNSTFNAWLGNHDGADGTCQIRPGLHWKKIHRQAQAEALQKKTSADAVFRERLVKFLTAKPLQAGLLFVRKALLVFAPGELPAGADTPGIFRRTPLMRYGATPETWLVMILGLAGLFVICRDRALRTEWKVMLFLFGSFYAVQILFVTSGRYRLPMLPAMFIFAGVFLQGKNRSRIMKLLPPTVSAGVAAAAFLLMPSMPDDAESRTLYAEALLRKKQPEQAVRMLKECLPRSADPVRDLCMLAIAEQKMRDWQSAEQHFLQAAQADPQEADALMNLGILKSEQGQLNEAARCFEQALRREPDHPGVLYNYALLLEKQSRYASAETCLQKTLQLTPDFVPALNALGRVCFSMKRYAEAESCFLRALQSAPEHAGLKRNLEITRKKLLLQQKKR